MLSSLERHDGPPVAVGKEQQHGGAVALSASAACDQWKLPACLPPIRVHAAPYEDCSSGRSIRSVAACLAGHGAAVARVAAPMQELAGLLSRAPAVLHVAFMQTAAGAAGSKAGTRRSSRDSWAGGSVSQAEPLGTQQQQHYSMVPIGALPQLLAAAVPHWAGADISYAALQMRCHMNIVGTYSLDTPLAAGTRPFRSSGGGSARCSGHGGAAAAAAAAAPNPPTELMFAELAGTIISAAATEAAAAEYEAPAAVHQLLVDLTDELASSAASRSRLQQAWATAEATARQSGSSIDSQQTRLPVVAAMRLLCRQLIGSHGLADIRLFAWLTCLVRQQHIRMQDAAAAEQQQQCGTASPGCSSDAGVQHALPAEVTFEHFCELLLVLVQSLAEASAQQQQRQQQEEDWWQQQQPGKAAWPPGLDTDHKGRSVPVRLPRRAMWSGSLPGSPSAWQQQQASYLSTTGRSCLGSQHGCSSSSGGGGGGGPAGRCEVLELQVQREQQLERLRAAQQRAWDAEMLRQEQPWEGAYSPLMRQSAGGAWRRCSCGSEHGCARVVDILRLSSTNGSCRSSDWGAC